MNDKVMQCIMDREVLRVPQFSLRKILKNYGVEIYENMCINRISDEVGIDGEDVVYDFTTGQIYLTCKGIKICKEVLKSYCNSDQLKELLECTITEEKYVISVNNMLWYFRNKSIANLKELLEEANKDEYRDMRSEVRDRIYAEIKSRSVWNQMRLSLRKGIANIAVRILYFRTFRMLRKATEEYKRETLCNAHMAVKDRHEVIHSMYKKYHAICPDKRSKEETLKYVYYGILDLGKRRGKYLCRDKECFEIAAAYEELSGVVKAAAGLTPRDFMNMFPVSKEYYGEKYGWKDYFYTMKNLERFPVDEEIGNTILPFMDIYFNDHISFFWVNYVTCIDDYSIYCGIKEPSEQYYSEIKSYWKQEAQA